MCVVYYSSLKGKSKGLEKEGFRWVGINWHGERVGQGLNRSGHV